jgi:hypothetical protein
MPASPHAFRAILSCATLRRVGGFAPYALPQRVRSATTGPVQSRVKLRSFRPFFERHRAAGVAGPAAPSGRRDRCNRV